MPVHSRLPVEFANMMQRGVMAYRYKGVPALKCPIDIAIYMDVLFDLRPGTVIEFGSNKGGSALWLADMLGVFGLRDTKVYSYDVNPVTDLKDPRIVFGYCDTRDLSASLSDSFMRALPRPLLVIDDASHNYHQVLNVLEFCHRHSAPGDYFIVEDGLISIVGVEDLHGYEGGAVSGNPDLLAKIPRSLCHRSRTVRLLRSQRDLESRWIYQANRIIVGRRSFLLSAIDYRSFGI
jgi:cephalosporin hydroxylase